MSAITHIGLGIPPNAYTQAEIFAVMGLRRLYWDVFKSAGILKRHLCYPPEVTVKSTAQEHHDHFQEGALKLALQAVTSCLEKAGLKPTDIQCMAATNCTGFMCPGLEHEIAGELGMRDDMVLTPLQGVGCGGLGPTLRRVDDYLRLNPGHRALAVAVEVSGAAYHPKRNNIGLILGNAIFADGAAALLVEGMSSSKGLHLIKFHHLHDYANRHTVGMVWDDAMLKLELPSRTAEISTPLIKRMHALLTKDGETPKHVVIHSGGMSILDQAREVLGLDKEMLKHSYKTWESYGNMSSATIGFSIESLMSSGELKDGDVVEIMVMGAGFSVDGILAYYG